jgi:hypothetical protein
MDEGIVEGLSELCFCFEVEEVEGSLNNVTQLLMFCKHTRFQYMLAISRNLCLHPHTHFFAVNARKSTSFSTSRQILYSLFRMHGFQKLPWLLQKRAFLRYLAEAKKVFR